MAEKKRGAAFLTRPWVVLPIAAALIIAAALFWYPPLSQNGYAPADERPFFAQLGEGININTAAAAELSVLPGVGEKRAQAIIEYREAHGPFASREEIMEVSGIGPGIFADIEDLIVLE